ncbi:MAG TPA: winged helix-turn-helix domain-containing protein [Candidatus Dormibacteraeota bacterium]|jgi:DNA-binding transcriptional ArsR family regulator
MTELMAQQPGLEVHVREAARRLQASPAAISVVLRDLETEGLLTSRWIGRSRVFRVAAAALPGDVRRPMTTHFPATPAEWDLRPYFLWDRDLSWREFREVINGPDRAQSGWAVARLLDHARWADTWRLVSPGQVRRELPHLRVKHKDVWRDLVGAGRAPG